MVCPERKKHPGLRRNETFCGTGSIAVIRRRPDHRVVDIDDRVALGRLAARIVPGLSDGLGQGHVAEEGVSHVQRQRKRSVGLAAVSAAACHHYSRSGNYRYGKKSRVEDYRKTNRGTKGVKHGGLVITTTSQMI